jgi:hypothetical protein
MKRTNRHAQDTAKSAQQPAFKPPAQELEEFKAKVLAMRNGVLIWVELDARVSLNQICQQAQDDGPLIRDAYSWSAWWQALEAVVPVKELLAAAGEIHRQVAELWPEYKRLLERDPDAREAYIQRYDQNCLLHKVRPGARELLPTIGAPPKFNLAREALELFQRQQRKNYRKIAEELNLKHRSEGDPTPCTAESVRKLLKRHYPDKI